MTDHHDLERDEQLLAGSWIATDEGLIPDAVDQRIFWLVSRRLLVRGQANGGWDQLYVDPRDGRLWELTFPEGSLFGGGPRRLACMGVETAIAKYGPAVHNR